MKPGYMTTEFWVTLATNAWAMFGGMVPAPWNGIIVAVATAAYAIARALTKSGVINFPEVIAPRKN